jgi:hypothetical protein
MIEFVRAAASLRFTTKNFCQEILFFDRIAQCRQTQAARYHPREGIGAIVSVIARTDATLLPAILLHPTLQLQPSTGELTRRDKIDKSKIESGTSDDVAS